MTQFEQNDQDHIRRTAEAGKEVFCDQFTMPGSCNISGCKWNAEKGICEGAE